MKIIFIVYGSRPISNTQIWSINWSHHREIVLQREKLRLSKNVYSSCLHLKAIRIFGQFNLIFHTAQGNLFYVLLKNKDIEQITTAVWLIKSFLISKMV